jgi:hypothetical protein
VSKTDGEVLPVRQRRGRHETRLETCDAGGESSDRRTGACPVDDGQISVTIGVEIAGRDRHRLHAGGHRQPLIAGADLGDDLDRPPACSRPQDGPPSSSKSAA